MSRVMMLVINPMVNDSRVDKEAASLAAAGHEVTVVAMAAEDLPLREQRNGFTIVRRPYRRAVKDRVLAPSQRMQARRDERAAAIAALRGTGGRNGAVGLRALDVAQRILARAWMLAGGTLLKAARSRILTLEYRLGITRRLPQILERPDVIHAHDLGPLAAAVRLAAAWQDRGTRPQVIYDSHELYTEQQTKWRRRERVLWRLHERRWIRHADAVITVSNGIAEELQRRYRLYDRPSVVLNSPLAGRSDPDAADVRTDADTLDNTYLAAYVGTVKPGRGVDRLVPALRAVPGWDLAIVGAGSGADVIALHEAATRAGVAERLHLLDAVPANRLPTYLRSADVGVHPMERTCLNHELALPNKLFDYLFAGLPVAVSDLREMRSLVERWHLGYTFDPMDEHTTGAAILQAARCGQECRAPSELLDRLRWQAQEQQLYDVYRKIASGRSSRGRRRGYDRRPRTMGPHGSPP